MRRLEDTAMDRAVGVDRHSGARDEPATRASLAHAGRNSGGADWPGGDGRAEEDLRRGYGIPPERPRRSSTAPSRSPRPDTTHEAAGPTYRLLPSDQEHVGDPLAQLIIAGGPRALPVTQIVEHGPAESRNEEFEEAARLGELHAHLGYLDRRFEGRRYRSGSLYDLEANRPYPKDPEPDWSRGY
jgi:hypothetical protein